MKRSGANRAKVVQIVNLLCAQPRTIPELCELTGMTRDNVGFWVKAFAAAGRVAPVGKRMTTPKAKRVTVVYGWSA